MFGHLLGVHARVDQVAQARADRGGQGLRPQFLRDAEGRSAIQDAIDHGVVEDGIRHERSGGKSAFLDNQGRERVEGVKMDVEQGHRLFDRQKAFQPVGHHAGRRHHEHRLAAFGGL